MALHAVVCAHHQDGVVERGERALGLRGEVHVAGCVNEHEVGAVFLVGARPVERRAGREDRDPAVPLHGIGVQVGAAAVHATGVANGPRGGEHGLRERGLARVDVRQEPHDRLPHATSR